MINKETFKEIIEKEIVSFMNSNYSITFNLHDGYEQVVKKGNQGIFSLFPIEHSIAMFKSIVSERYLHLSPEFKNEVIEFIINNWWNTTKIIQTLPKIPKL